MDQSSMKRSKMTEVVALPFSQAATSDDEFGNVLNKFFAGTLNNAENTHPEAGVDRMFNTIYSDETLHANLGIITMALVSKNLDFVAKYIFPVHFTENTQYTSTVIQFNRSFMTQVPTLGVAKSFTNVIENKISQSRRYGAAFMLESDQFLTPKGRDDFVARMQHLTNMIKTNYEMVGWANLMRHHEYKLRFNTRKLIDALEFIEALRQEKREFAQPYKSAGGFRRSVQDSIHLINVRTGVPAKYTIIPRQKMSLLTDPTTSDYSKMGDRGVDNIVGDGEIREICSVTLLAAPVYSGPIIGGTLSPLDTEVRVGQYHLYTNRHRHLVPTDGKMEYVYDKFMADQMFNINANQFQTLSYTKCLQTDGRFSEKKDAGAGVHLLDRDPYKTITNQDEDLFNRVADNNVSALTKLKAVRSLNDAEARAAGFTPIPAAPNPLGGAAAFPNVRKNYDIRIGDVKQFLDPLFLECLEKRHAEAVDVAETALAAVPAANFNDLVPGNNGAVPTRVINAVNKIYDDFAKAQPADVVPRKWNNAINADLMAAFVVADAAGALVAVADNADVLAMTDVHVEAGIYGIISRAAGNDEIPFSFKLRFMKYYAPEKWVFCRDMLEKAVKERVPPAISFLLIRPHDAYRMQSQVFTADNAGFTYCSRPIFRVDYTGANGSQEYDVVCRVGVHVMDEARILIQPNQFYNGIISGGNNSLIDHANARKNKNTRFDPDNRDDPNRQSIYVCSVPWNTLQDGLLNSEYLDLTGRTHVDNVHDTLHWPCAKFYGDKYGFKAISEPYNLGNGVSAIARICYQDNVRVLNHAGTAFVDIPGQGHHGLYNRPGATDVRSTGTMIYPECKGDI